jgi:AcrR family transcriptional regulator
VDVTHDESAAEGIRNAALECFATKGYHASSLREIGRRCDLTLGTIYHYYPSKEGLLFDLMEEAMLPLLESLKKIRAERDPSPADQLFWAIWSFVEYAAMHRRLSIVADVELRSLGEANLATVLKWRDTYQKEIRAIVDRGCREQLFRVIDPKISVFAILAAANQVARWYEPDGDLSVVEVSTRVAMVAMQLVGYDASELGARAVAESLEQRPPGDRVTVRSS